MFSCINCLCIYKYICIHTCSHVNMYACMWGWMFVWIYVRVRIWIIVHACIKHYIICSHHNRHECVCVLTPSDWTWHGILMSVMSEFRWKPYDARSGVRDNSNSKRDVANRCKAKKQQVQGRGEAYVAQNHAKWYRIWNRYI